MSDSELSESDNELQVAFAEGKLKPGLNVVEQPPRQFANNVVCKNLVIAQKMITQQKKHIETFISGLKQKLEEIKLKLPWIELLDCTNKEAPLAPELAAQMLSLEQQRENQQKNNKKLPQFMPADDPVLNDFKRESMFYRQAQNAAIESISKLKEMKLPTKRPDDYFAEMAKTDEHMQKIRENLMKKQEQKKRSERIKQLRQQRKEGKTLQVQIKLDRQKEKKEMLDRVKKVRKGLSKDLDFLDGKKNKSISRKALEKRRLKDNKFGFGGKKRGMKINTKDSAADISEYRNPGKPGKNNTRGKHKRGSKTRPGRNKRVQNKARGKR